jgi:DNA-binding LytR/AlgR family response regulator
MTTIRVLVAEDERPQREALTRMLAAEWPAAHVVAECEDGLEALEAFEREAPDVAFLDIRMPGLSGIEVARELSGRAHVVFVTAHDAHAVQAFEHGAVDYLLKPLDPERLRAAIARLESRIPSAPPPIEALLQEVRRAMDAKRSPLRFITATTGETVTFHPIEQVVAFHARDKYTMVLLEQGEAVIRTSLRELTEALDPDVFWQVHRSVVVRAAAIAHVKRDEARRLVLTLRGRTETLPVSEAFRSRFRGM